MGLLFFLVGAQLSSQSWELVRDGDGIKLWQAPVEQSDIDAIRVEYFLEASSSTVWNVLRDVPRYHRFMAYMAEARILQEEGNVRYVYQRVDPPIGSQRDYTLKITAFEDFDTGVFEQRLELANEKGPASRDDVIRVLRVRGRWLLEPVSESRTRLLYEIHTDPGGMVPDWAVNFGQRRSLPKLVRALQNEVKRAQKAKAPR